ncbi:hypothetical protein CcaCcLH18_08414 [Colletotrichum camelliae]|nr:hypothetical protein CcaCcLH18_08414 [Colletotrichum camelliae]
MIAILPSALSAALLVLSSLPGSAAELKISSHDEIVESSSKLAKSLFTFYEGDKPGKIPGILPGPPYYFDRTGDYYWFQGAAFWQTYLDYQHLTGDDSFQASVLKGMAFQVGPNNDYMPPNWTASLGNDDQCFWGSAALQAAEYQLPNADGKPSWIDLAKNVWTTQASPDRHDETCGGGLRWQVPFSNNGYDYKNSISNGCFLSMSARLARYTGNATYAEQAEKTWDWLSTVGFIDNKTSAVYDGAHVDSNCTDIAKFQWSQNAAVLIEGAAFMYNFTDGSEVWKDRLAKLVESALETFFPKKIAYEPACEGLKKGSCPTDALFMKGYVHRWLAVATQVAPFISEVILPTLQSSAEAAVKHCIDNSNGTVTCGFYWSEAEFVDPMTADNTTGVGEGTSALSAISGLLINSAKDPVTEKTGGSGGGSGSGSGSGSGGSATGTSGSASPTETTSAADRFGVGAKTTWAIGALAVFVWVL